MNGDQFEGICRQLAGRMNEIWGEWTDDPLRVANSNRARIFGEVQQRRGLEKEESERQMKDFLTRNRDWYF